MKASFCFGSIITFVVISHFSANSMAAVFKCMDHSGKVTYSDRPCPASSEESIHHLPIEETVVKDPKVNLIRNFEFVRAVNANDLRRVRHMLVADPSLADAELPIGHNQFQVHAVHIAAGLGNIQLVKELLEFKANPNYTDEAGRSALFYTVGGMTPGVMDGHQKNRRQSTEEKRLRRTIGEVLIKAGAQVDVKAPIEHLATVAAYHNHEWLVELYLQGPTDANVLQIALRWAKNNDSDDVLRVFKTHNVEFEDSI